MKTTRIIYWTTTIIFCVGMSFSGIPYIFQNAGIIHMSAPNLGYPTYFFTILGTGKMIGVIILVAAFPR